HSLAQQLERLVMLAEPLELGFLAHQPIQGSGDLGVVWYQASEVVGQAYKLLDRFLRPWRRELSHRLGLFLGRQATVIPDFEPEKVDLGEAKCALLGIDSQVRV